MKTVKLASNDSGEFELGLTQDSGEVTNDQGYRVLVEFNQEKPSVIGVEGVNTSGIWAPIESDSFKQLLDGLLTDHYASLDADLLKNTKVFYVEILKNVAGDPYRGILAPMDEINKIIDAPNPRIDESRFIRDYAIFFLRHYKTMCDEDKEYPAKYIAAMRRWSTEVAQLNTPVDVVDESGAILFTIPPAISTSDTFNNEVGPEIHEIMYEASHIGQTDPAGAERYVEKQLVGKLVDIPKEELKDQDRARVLVFDEIRERYNIPRWLPKVEVATTTNSDSNATTTTQNERTGFSDNEMGEF